MAALPTGQKIFGNAGRYELGVNVAKDTVQVTTILGIPMTLGFVAVTLHLA